MLPKNIYNNDNNAQCYITSAGKHRVPAGHKNSLFLLDKTVIHYVESGKGTFTMNGKTYSLSAGDAFYIPRRIRGDYKADEKDPWNYTWIYFQRGSGDRFFEDLGLTPDAPVYTTKDPDRINSLVATLHDESDDKYRTVSDIYALLSAMVTTNIKPVPKRKQSGDEFIASCRNYIMLYTGRKVTVSDLCEHLKIDRTYLFRLFKSHLDMGPLEFIARTKLETAQQLLLESSLSVSEIGQMTGFDDPFSFSRQFKKYYGVSPRTYAKERKNHETI